MKNMQWYYFEAEDRHYTAIYHFQALSREEAEAKARILYGNHDPVYGEILLPVDETTNDYHASAIKHLIEKEEDDFENYLRRNKEKISQIIEVLHSYSF